MSVDLLRESLRLNNGSTKRGIFVYCKMDINTLIVSLVTFYLMELTLNEEESIELFDFLEGYLIDSEYLLLPSTLGNSPGRVRIRT